MASELKLTETETRALAFAASIGINRREGWPSGSYRLSAIRALEAKNAEPPPLANPDDLTPRDAERLNRHHAAIEATQLKVEAAIDEFADYVYDAIHAMKGVP